MWISRRCWVSVYWGDTPSHQAANTVHCRVTAAHTQTRRAHKATAQTYKWGHSHMPSFLYTHRWARCEKPNLHTNLQNHLKQTARKHKEKKNQINCTESAQTRCGHKDTCSWTHRETHTYLSEHEWRRQSVHKKLSWSWICQSQQLNTSLDVKVSN